MGGRGPQVHDEFIGLYSIPQTDAGTITTVSTECVLPVEPTSEHVSQSVLQYNRAAGLDIKLVDAVARGASRFENLLAPLKTYWPPPPPKTNWPLPRVHFITLSMHHSHHTLSIMHFMP